MSQKKTQVGPKNLVLNAMLDFGPDDTKSNSDSTLRIQKIIKKLQEISKRIDSLSSRI